MIQVKPFEQHASEYDAWFEKYPEVYESELLAIRQQMLKMPENVDGIEVGLGTGRFAAPLGITEGVEPAAPMRRMAVRRGVIDVMDARAEHLPYRDLHFDFVLFVTICHLDKVPEAFREAFRVLKKGGSAIIGFLDRDRPVAAEYEARRQRSDFYRQATFYSVESVQQMLEEAGFRDLEFMQTLFGKKLDEIREVQSPKEGFGDGSFVVVRAIKKQR